MKGAGCVGVGPTWPVPVLPADPEPDAPEPDPELEPVPEGARPPERAGEPPVLLPEL